jgi:hypothetical protein
LTGPQGGIGLSRLNNKVTIEQLRDISKTLHEIHYNATHWITRSTASETELELISTIDYLCRVTNILCNIIEQELEGHIETHDPMKYVEEKLLLSHSSINSYLKVKELNFE